MNIFNFIKNNCYLIIPIICFIFWALLSLIKDHFSLDPADFDVFYYAGKYITTQPLNLYSGPAGQFFNLPIIAYLFSPLSIFDYNIAKWIYFFILLFLGVIAIIEFNKILIIKNTNKIIRFLCLMAMVNGHLILQEYDFLNIKIIVLLLVVIFLRREVELSSFGRERNKYSTLIIQLIILNLIIAFIPHFLYIVPIYLLYGNSYKKYLCKSQIMKYSLFFILFFAMNFMFLMIPSLITDFLYGFSHVKVFGLNFYDITPEMIMENKWFTPVNTLAIISLFFEIDTLIFSIISIVCMVLITCLLFLNQKISLEKKFGFLALSSLFLNIYFKHTNFLFTVPLILILFVDYSPKPSNIENYRKLNSYKIFIMENYLFLIGIIFLALLIFLPPLFYIYVIIPILRLIPLYLIIFYYTYIYIIILICLLLILRSRTKIESNV
ncbi:MAG: hypothetical protein HWN81_21115 [Candidatus Lokiarchaeota archaeon]|nr:hypothetical protein [Candidatus Lokiarchaeota archaeon]